MTLRRLCDHISIRRGEFLQAQDRPVMVSPQIEQKIVQTLWLALTQLHPLSAAAPPGFVPHSTKADEDMHAVGPPVSPILGDLRRPRLHSTKARSPRSILAQLLLYTPILWVYCLGVGKW